MRRRKSTARARVESVLQRHAAHALAHIFFNRHHGDDRGASGIHAAFILTSGASGATLGGPGNAMLFYAL
jgi:hypothetical protein